MADRLSVAVIGDEALLERVADAWTLSKHGEVEAARAAYSSLDGFLPSGFGFDADLSVLRHNPGHAVPPHIVRPIPPTEDRVVTFTLGPTSIPEQTDILAHEPEIAIKPLMRGIGTFLQAYDPGVYRKNVTGDGRHIMVLSTGRCGTVSLYQLLSQHPLLLPYHTFWWSLSMSTRIEMMCRLMAAQPDAYVADLWASTRAAEWLGAEANGRIMVGTNHLDTIFAPVFAAIHPKCRFIHLRRDPVKVFDSFFAKLQWNSQLQPVTYAFGGGFVWSPIEPPVPRAIAWYIRFTEVFARAMGQVVGRGRYIEVSSDKLFARDVDEIRRLSDFVGVGIDPSHFETRINAKDHKVCVTDRDLYHARQDFLTAYKEFGGYE